MVYRKNNISEGISGFIYFTYDEGIDFFTGKCFLHAIVVF